MRQKNWWSDITKAQWQTLLASHLGWLLDGFDIMLFAFALLRIKEEFQLSSAQAGSLASATLAASAIGGGLAGFLADRWGRARVLGFSILFYSVFTGLTATAHTITALVLWRVLVGVGLGAEWSTGSVLVSESWPAQHRGKASGFMQAGWAIGYMTAALLSALVLPKYGWRFLFALGVVPAFLTFWIRKNIPEPEIWRKKKESRPNLREFFARPILKRILLATCLTTSLLFAYWGLFTWLPSFLSLPSSQGGAGLGVTKSLEWILLVQGGAFAGYVSFGFLADSLGRRRTFVGFVLIAAVIVPVFGLLRQAPNALLFLSPLLGFFGHGYFSLFGAFLSELFDTSIRGAAQGLCYNVGRALSSVAPIVVGYLADRHGMGVALAMTSGFYIIGAVIMMKFPETKGVRLS